jgi:hypothetical protein
MRIMRKNTIFDLLYVNKIREKRARVSINDYANDFLMFDRHMK